MCQWAGILAELAGAQAAHVADPFHRATALIGGELLIAIHRQAFFNDN